ncbi:chitosanase [Dactylosporangium roseum]|nr:chitosanase [Dactylosporangium roseum]
MRRTTVRRRLGVAVFLIVSLAMAGLATPDQEAPGVREPTAHSTPARAQAPGTDRRAVVASPVASPSKRSITVPSGQRIRGDLSDPRQQDIAMRLLSSAENSTLDWTARYAYIEDIGDGRGYTAGIVGFRTGTGDLKTVVERYTTAVPRNRLAAYLPALRKVNGTESHEGLDPGFVPAWQAAAADPAFRRAQDAERDRMYFTPALSQAKQDGLKVLGQFAYFDAIVTHGATGLATLRRAAAQVAPPPAKGGDEAAYLEAFLDARIALMNTERARRDLSRIESTQRVFLRDRNFDLSLPLRWTVHGDAYEIGT